MPDLVYYVATSLDGYIAGPDDDVSAFAQGPDTLAELFERYPETCPVQARAALGVTAPPRRFGTVLMGRRTFEPAVAAGLPEGAYPHLEQVVVSRRVVSAPGVRTLTDDVHAEVARLKERPGADIWLCGGGDVAGQLVDLVDELQLKVNPIVLGGGVPVLRHDGPPLPWRLVLAEQLPGGVVLTTYRRAP